MITIPRRWTLAILALAATWSFSALFLYLLMSCVLVGHEIPEVVLILGSAVITGLMNITTGAFVYYFGTHKPQT